jgi:ABC-type multidrug transport system permease subunit
MSTVLLRAMAVFAVAGLLQGLVSLRYISRVSDDRSVIIWYFIVLVSYAVIAVFFYVKWVKERRKEEGECSEKK